MMEVQSGPLLGFHVSISGSIDLSVDRALEIGCTTFQIFTRNPRGWSFKPLGEEQAQLFREKRKKAGYERVVAHMPYLPNLATSIKPYQKQSRASLKEEVARCSLLGIDYLVAHIGSHMEKGTMAGVKNVIGACNEALEANPGTTVLLIETMAGQKNSVGSRFEELRLILDGVKESERIGVCFDTCHVFAAGFDLSSVPAVERTMGLFRDIVGEERLKVVHLNDSVGPLGSGLDRHDHIGMGQIGEKGFRAFLRYGNVAKLPILMETPVDERRKDEENMKLVRRLIGA
jgi:deoxyribonuclease IV